MDIKKAYIYRYQKGQDTPLCIYLCNTQAKNRIMIVPLKSNDSDGAYKLSVTKQYADIKNYTEIDRSLILSQLFLASKPVKIPDTDLNAIETLILKDIMEQIFTDAHHHNTRLSVFESLYQFLMWKRKKLQLNYAPFQPKTTVYENGIYWAALGVNVGSELNKNRPVLIWKKRCSGNNHEAYSYIVIPITSQSKNSKYYMNVPIQVNGDTCYLRIEDMKRINIKRISRPIVDNNGNILFIDAAKRQEVKDAIKQFYLFDNKHISN